MLRNKYDFDDFVGKNSRAPKSAIFARLSATVGVANLGDIIDLLRRLEHGFLGFPLLLPSGHWKMTCGIAFSDLLEHERFLHNLQLMKSSQGIEFQLDVLESD